MDFEVSFSLSFLILHHHIVTFTLYISLYCFPKSDSHLGFIQFLLIFLGVVKFAFFALYCRESYQFMYNKPWKAVNDFYYDLVNGCSTLAELFSLKVGSFGSICFAGKL